MQDDYLSKHTGFLNKLKTNVKAIHQYTKLFNTLCPSCRNKVQQNPRMKLEEYCNKCQNKVKFRIGKVKELMGIKQ